MAGTIVLVHGAWMNPLSWEKFRERYEARGYEVLTPAWPHEDMPLEELRRAPPAALRTVSIRDIVDHHARLVEALPEPPILIGHSFGGLFVQLLLDRGLGSVGVAIDPAPTRGVLPRPRAVASSASVLFAPLGWSRVLTMSLRSFATTFAQTLPEAEKPAAYERYVTPTPGRIFFQDALGIGTGINKRNPKRAPLLMTLAEHDRTVPPGMVRANFRQQRHAPSVTELIEFPHRSHFLCVEAGWEEVADTVLDWAERHRRVS